MKAKRTKGNVGVGWQLFAETGGEAIYDLDLLACVPAAAQIWDDGGEHGVPWIWLRTRGAALMTRAEVQRRHPSAEVRIFAVDLEYSGEDTRDEDDFTVDVAGVLVPKRSRK